MEYKAGSKIICEIMRSKFYPIVLSKNIFNCCRYHHAMAIQDISRLRKLGKSDKEDILITKFFWRGFKQGMVSNLIAFKLLNPGRYIFGRISNYSSGNIMPVAIDSDERFGDDTQQHREHSSRLIANDRAARLSELLSEGEVERQYKSPRNLNAIAFKEKHHGKNDLRPKNQSRLRMPSKSTWNIPAIDYPKTKYQFIVRKTVASDVVFTDELSAINEELKQRLCLAPPAKVITSSSPVSRLENLSHRLRNNEKLSTAVDPSSLGAEKKHQMRKSEIMQPEVNKERTLQVFRSKSKVSSGVVCADNIIRSPLQPMVTARKDSTGVPGNSKVRSLIANQSKYVHSSKQLTVDISSPTSARQNGQHINPESISSSYSSITSTKFHELTPRFRLRRDLISVINNTTRIPIINRKLPKKLNRAMDDLKMELTPLYKSVAPVTKREKHKSHPEPQVKTWNFTPKRARFGTRPTTNRNYSYRYALNPAGTTLRQTIVIKTPKYTFPKDADTLTTSYISRYYPHEA